MEKGSSNKSLIFGGRVVGPSHLKMGTVCQDAFAFRLLSDTSGVIAVADGLGSARCSDLGSQTAVARAVEVSAPALENSDANPNDLQRIALESIVAARLALEELPTTAECALKDVASTLIVVVFSGSCMVAANIGDGAVVASIGETCVVISPPAPSEYVNEVVPLTANNWREMIRVSDVFDSVTAIGVFTDGLVRAALRRRDDTHEAIHSFWMPIFEFAGETVSEEDKTAQLEEFLSGLKLSNNSDDDKTLVLAVIGKRALDESDSLQ